MSEADGRNMVTYQCRLTPKAKRLLLQCAAAERRTANKIVNDALYIYYAMDKQERKEWKKAGIRVVENSTPS